MNQMKMTTTKAYVGAIVGGVTAFLGGLLQLWTDTDPLTLRDFVQAFTTALSSGAITGFFVFRIPNEPEV